MTTLFAGTRKTVVAVVGAVISFATIVIESEPTKITAGEWLVGGIGVATALGVYRVVNDD